MQTKDVNSHRDLIVWQKVMKLIVAVYDLMSQFPKEEMYELISQVRRSATSIPSNTIEGKKRGATKDHRQFLLVVYDSSAELEIQIKIARMLSFGKNLNYATIDKLL